LIIPEQFQLHSPSVGINEKFLLTDSSQEIEKILIFKPSITLENLRDSNAWYTNSTFKVAPLLFVQIYVTVAESLLTVHPLIYALLLNKIQKTFKNFYIILKSFQPNLNPNSIVCDLKLVVL